MAKLFTIKTRQYTLQERRDGWWKIISGSYRGIPAKNEFGGGHNEVNVSWPTARKYGYPRHVWDRKGNLR
ncbi:MAG: hypothetical protein ACREBR_05050 [bacterium]